MLRKNKDNKKVYIFKRMIPPAPKPRLATSVTLWTSLWLLSNTTTLHKHPSLTCMYSLNTHRLKQNNLHEPSHSDGSSGVKYPPFSFFFFNSERPQNHIFEGKAKKQIRHKYFQVIMMKIMGLTSLF